MNNDRSMAARIDDINISELHKEAEKGNAEAIKLCFEIMEKKRFIDLVNNMDEDEFAM